MTIIGIDLGTTNSLVAYWNKNHCELIPNSFGEYLTPSVVSVDNNEVVVGKIAKERLISHPNCTTSEFKRFMGTKKEIILNNRTFKPEELSALVLKQLKQDAEEFLKTEITEAIISVPAYFNDNQRNATKLAGQLAGLKVERLINEPSAAALAYQTQFDIKEQKYMIVDFGGGTLDISIVDVFDDMVEIVSVSGDNQLGGKDFNNVITNYFYKQNNFTEESISSEDKAIIYKLAENCKIALSQNKLSVMLANINEKEYSISLDIIQRWIYNEYEIFINRSLYYGTIINLIFF